MEGVTKTSKQQKYRQKEIKTVYSPCQITKSIVLPVIAIGENLHQTIENLVSKMIEGKCIVEGYVKTGSVKVITFSSGLVKSDNIIFNVVFGCEVCYPVAGMNLTCVARNITKAGIRAESYEETPSPFVLFIARDHYYSDNYFNSIDEGNKFTARVLASRFELNDKYVSVIADIIHKKDFKQPLLIEE